MPFPFESAALLVTAPRHVPLRVTHIHFDPIRDRCAQLGVREGDEVTCLDVSDEHMSLAVAGRPTVKLALSLSTCMEVEPVQEPARNRPPVRVPMTATWPASNLSRFRLDTIA